MIYPLILLISAALAAAFLAGLSAGKDIYEPRRDAHGRFARRNRGRRAKG